MNEKIVEMLTRLAIENPGVQGRFKLAAGIVYRNFAARHRQGTRRRP